MHWERVFWKILKILRFGANGEMTGGLDSRILSSSSRKMASYGVELLANVRKDFRKISQKDAEKILGKIHGLTAILGHLALRS